MGKLKIAPNICHFLYHSLESLECHRIEDKQSIFFSLYPSQQFIDGVNRRCLRNERPKHSIQLKPLCYLKQKEGRNVLFNNTVNTFYLRLYGVRHMVKDHSDSERGNPLPPHGLVFLINSKGYFICIIPQTG